MKKNYLESLNTTYKSSCASINDGEKRLKRRRRRRVMRKKNSTVTENTVVTKKTKKTVKWPKHTKSKIEQSVIKRGQIYCINGKKNKTAYWGGETCNTHIDHDGQIVRFVCSTCVAKMMPAPTPRSTPKIDPVTGEKRKRGRPKGSTNKPKTITTNTKKGKK